MPSSAESPRPHVPAEAVTAIAALAENAVAEHRTSGVTWAIIGGHAHDQAILAHGAAGHRELADGRPAPGSSPMDRATVSRIASMTKSFTSATILALRDEGRLSLDLPIGAGRSILFLLFSGIPEGYLGTDTETDRIPSS